LTNGRNDKLIRCTGGKSATRGSIFAKCGVTIQTNRLIKKYKTKASQSYRKRVDGNDADAAAVKRGEAVSESAAGFAAMANGGGDNVVTTCWISVHVGKQKSRPTPPRDKTGSGCAAGEGPQSSRPASQLPNVR
jgi:hypothetical protein